MWMSKQMVSVPCFTTETFLTNKSAKEINNGPYLNKMLRGSTFFNDEVGKIPGMDIVRPVFVELTETR